MLIGEKHLYYLDSSNFSILTIKNNAKNVVRRISLIASVFNNISNRLKKSE